MVRETVFVALIQSFGVTAAQVTPRDLVVEGVVIMRGLLAMALR